jgi:hypothetical protein
MKTTTTYVCVYVLWERVDVRWEFYLCKKTPPLYIEDLWGDLGLGYRLLTGRGTRRLGDWISGTRDAAA